jgi:uncharacterized Zn-finger protein
MEIKAISACDQCEKSFTQPKSLKFHIVSVHQGLKPYACEQCYKSFSQASYVKQHIASVHEKIKLFKCDQCDKSFSHSGDIKKHIKCVHEKLKPFSCDQCDLKFFKSNHRKMHIQSVHEKLKLFSCGRCDKTFFKSANFKQHIASVHEGKKTYVCTQCGQTFSYSGHLKRHERHHEESKKWTFVCLYADGKVYTEEGSCEGLECGIRCKTQLQLDYHIQSSHTEEGFRKKMKSETKLAEFFDSKGCVYDRDRVNFVSLTCKPEMKLTGLRCYPDFYLLGLSAELGAHVIVGLDEHGHRQYACDLRRTLMLTAAIGASSTKSLPIVYVRFNPHYYHVDGVLRDRPLDIVFEELWKVLCGLTRASLTTTGLHLIYINYDQISVAPRRLAKSARIEVNEVKLWRRLDLFAKLDADPNDINSENALLLRDCVIGVY